MRPHVRGVVLEGLSHAGKTSVLKALKLAQAERIDSERSVLVLGEHYSQQLQTIKGEQISLSCDEHAELINDRLGCIEQLNDWAINLGEANRRSRGLFFILERFHLNHRSAYDNSVHIGTIEERLVNLNCTCLLLTVSREDIRSRMLHRDDKGIGHGNIDHVCSDWIKAQERFIELAHKSRVPSTTIDTSERKWNAYASKILNLVDD